MPRKKWPENAPAMVANLPRALVDILQAHPQLAIAFSGGIDSRFLCLAAKLCGCQILAIHIRGPHIPASASKYATEWARRNSIPIAYAHFNPLANRDSRFNRRGRCRACKQGMIAEIGKTARQYGAHNWPICDGTQLDDLQGFRPGRAVLAQAGVISPLALAGMDKKQIRSTGANIGLSDCGQKSRPCLLTRFAYDLPVYEDQLRLVEACEDGLGALFANNGPADFRLRFAPEPLLQLGHKDMAAHPGLAALLNSFNLDHAEIAITPNLSGFFDRKILPAGGRPRPSA